MTTTPSSTFQYELGGSLGKNAPCYVTRQADKEFYAALKAGEFCYVLNSRQMGKSSLRVQVMQRLQADGFACAVIDITSVGSQGITAAEWYLGIIRRLVRSFRVQIDALTWWNEREGLPPVQRLNEFLEEVLLIELPQKIVIFIDEIDSILKLEFKDDFFALIRACYNQRAESLNHQRLTFALLGVATPSDLIQDKSRTPFNIGKAINLRGFQLQETQPLVQGLLEKAENPQEVFKAILNWTGGQPFLTQKLCKLVTESQSSIAIGQEAAAVEQLVKLHIIENWESQDEPEHLRTIRDRILKASQHAGRLLGLYQQILQQKSILITNNFEQTELQLTGLVIQQFNNLKIANRIYESIFNLVWVEDQLANLRPYSESFASWVKSQCKDESRLLRGRALQDALSWASDKNLSYQDYQFLTSSQEFDNRQIKAELDIERKAKEAAEKAGQLLAEMQRQTKLAISSRKHTITNLNKSLAFSHLFANLQFSPLTCFLNSFSEPITQLATGLRIFLSQGSQRHRTSNFQNIERKRSKTSHLLTYCFLVLVLFSLTSAIGHRFYNAPKLDVGKAAPQTILSPSTATVEDTRATEEKRKVARKEAVSVLMLDHQVNQQIEKSIQRELDQGNRIRQFSRETKIKIEPPYDNSLLKLSDPEWRQTQTRLLQAADRILAQGIPAGLPQYILNAAVKLQVNDWVPAEAETIATNLLLASLQPNLVRDEAQTRLMAERAAQDVKPEMVSIRQGEVIVHAGETITTADFALLDEFKLSRRGVDWWGLIGFGVVVSGAVGIYWLVEQRFHPGMRRRDRVLIVLLTLSTPLLLALHVPSTNLPAVGLLVGSFYGSPLGVAVAVLLTLCLPIGTVLPWSHLYSSAAGGILCGFMAGRLLSREGLVLLGTAVGVLQGAQYLLLNVTSGAHPYTLLGSVVIHSLIGFLWCVVAVGVSPYFESIFQITSLIRLAELSAPMHPLLERLIAEATGTFQQTLFITTLAESAAITLKCNVELVRAGSLYHDIGKVIEPAFFTENQIGGLLKNDTQNTFQENAEIIKSHINEGLKIAIENKLPQAIQAFILEHHGTMLIADLYEQAKQQDSTPLNESDFRYDGPIPQSRETGIVMLADYCGSALLCLKDVGAAEAHVLLTKMVENLWNDGQFADSGLKHSELLEVANIFVNKWKFALDATTAQEELQLI